MIIAEQLPTKLVQDAVTNTNLKLMHRLTAEDDRRYLGETMGLDESQLKFATRLRTGEALVHSDDFAEAAHISITRSPAAATASAGPVPPSAEPPFSACSYCRAWCAHRGTALAIVRDPRTVSRVKSAVADLEARGLTAAEIESRWEKLLRRLYREIGAFAALPSADPGRSDAAFCLFLHALAIRTMRFSPAWPKAVAARLGITTKEVSE